MIERLLTSTLVGLGYLIGGIIELTPWAIGAAVVLVWAKAIVRWM